MKGTIPLSQLKPNQKATVDTITLTGGMGQRIGDLGLMEGRRVTCVHRSPSGDPQAYLICGAVIALRNRDAQEIFVKLEEEQ